MKAGDAVRTLAAVALIGNCPVASWQLLLSNLSSLPLSGFSEADLHQIHQTYLLLKNKGETCMLQHTSKAAQASQARLKVYGKLQGTYDKAFEYAFAGDILFWICFQGGLRDSCRTIYLLNLLV